MQEGRAEALDRQEHRESQHFSVSDSKVPTTAPTASPHPAAGVHASRGILLPHPCPDKTREHFSLKKPNGTKEKTYTFWRLWGCP